MLCCYCGSMAGRKIGRLLVEGRGRWAARLYVQRHQRRPRDKMDERQKQKPRAHASNQRSKPLLSCHRGAYHWFLTVAHLNSRPPFPHLHSPFLPPFLSSSRTLLYIIKISLSTKVRLVRMSVFLLFSPQPSLCPFSSSRHVA